jgi:streptogramin lyase
MAHLLRRLAAAAALLLLAGGPTLADPLPPGTILVTAMPPGTSLRNAVIRVDPVTGAQSILAQGPDLIEANGIVIDAAGNIFVADGFGGSFLGAVIRLDASTGQKTIVAEGGDIARPMGIAADAAGDLLVTSRVLGGPDKVIRVDPVTGAQTVVSQGGNLLVPTALAVDLAGNILVATSSPGAVIRIDPVTGAQTVVSRDDHLPESLWGIAVDDAADSVFVAGAANLTPPGVEPIVRVDAVLRVGLATGAQTFVSVDDNFRAPIAVAMDLAGNILLTDFNAPNSEGSIFRVDPVTGAQTVVAVGTVFTHPFGIAVAPQQAPIIPQPSTLALWALGALSLLGYRWKRRKPTA